jgi:hypothetical protein
MMRWLRGLFILGIVFRFGLDELVLSKIRDPFLRGLSRV